MKKNKTKEQRGTDNMVRAYRRAGWTVERSKGSVLFSKPLSKKEREEMIKISRESKRPKLADLWPKWWHKLLGI